MGIGGETVARLKAVVTVDNTGLKRGLAESETATERSTTKMQGLFKKAGQVSAIGFAVIGAAAFEGVKGAVALQQKMAVLDKQLRNAGISAKDTADASKYLEDQSNKTGFAIGDLSDSFGKSATALGSYKKAQAETALAENIARATGETLVMANKQAIKVYEGKNTALTKLGVVLPKITTAEDKLKATNKNATAAEKAHAKAIDQKRTAVADAKAATDKYKGATDAYGKTLAGQLTLTENRFKNLLDALGAKLLPVITSVFGFMAQHTNILIGVGAALLAIWAAATLVTAAVKAYAAYTKIAAAVQWLWNAAMDANPIGLVVIAIAALVAGVVLAYRHFSGFRDVVHSLWGKLQSVWKWIKGNWPLLLGILTGPIGLAVIFIATHFGMIKGYASDLVTWFKGLPGKIGNAISGLGGMLSGAFKGMAHGASGIVTGIVNDYLIRPLDSALNVIHDNWPSAPGLPGPPFGHNPIPTLARGGYVPGRDTGGRDSVLAMLAPGELVLNRKQQGRLANMLGIGGGSAGGGVTVNQTIITTTDDQGVHMRRARFAAQAAFG